MGMSEISGKDVRGTANGHEWTRIWSERRVGGATRRAPSTNHLSLFTFFTGPGVWIGEMPVGFGRCTRGIRGRND
jgi:hypothetical protein